MALIYKGGDILEATENIICHQVNVDGLMGGGLAKQIASRYPSIENEYKNFCEQFENNYDLLQSLALTYWLDEESKGISNCFTQKPNFETDYVALYECFDALLEDCKEEKMTIAIPYKYGCGIAYGDWNIVSKIFEDLSNKYGIDIVVYQLEGEKDGK